MIDSSQFESTHYSQSGEDGILQMLVKKFPIVPYAVEIGAEDASQCNTRLLRERNGFGGLMIDARYSVPQFNLVKEYIDRDNVLPIFQKYNVPKNIGILSLDIDGNDFYVLHSILKSEYHIQALVLEYNALYELQDKIITYDPHIMHDGSDYFGVGLVPLTRLCNQFGYSLFYTNRLGVNAFFIKNDLLSSSNIEFPHINNIEKLFTPYHYRPIPRPDTQCRKFVSFDEAISIN